MKTVTVYINNMIDKIKLENVYNVYDATYSNYVALSFKTWDPTEIFSFGFTVVEPGFWERLLSGKTEPYIVIDEIKHYDFDNGIDYIYGKHHINKFLKYDNFSKLMQTLFHVYNEHTRKHNSPDLSLEEAINTFENEK